MSGIKFSNTTPAAPAGKTLVQFQADGQGNISAAYEGDTLILTAATNINANSGIVVLSDGLAHYADAATLAHAGLFVGVSETSALAGNPVRIRGAGLVNNTGWSWTVGARVYVGLAGALTQSINVGLFEQAVGVATSAFDLDINIGPPIVYA
jgi:hypothetical protein